MDPPGSHAAHAGRKGFAMVVGAGITAVLVMLPLSLVWFKIVTVALFTTTRHLR